MTDDDLPFTYDRPTVQPSVTGWRSEPPTLVEFRRWPYWWIRKPCCSPELFGLDNEYSTDTIIGALWAPAIPPAP